MKIISSILTKFITIDTISTVIAKLIAKLLNNASKKGGESWNESKRIISKIRVWIDLFDQVYEDDEMTTEDETLVSKAISNEIEITKVSKILGKSTKEIQ